MDWKKGDWVRCGCGRDGHPCTWRGVVISVGSGSIWAFGHERGSRYWYEQGICRHSYPYKPNRSERLNFVKKAIAGDVVL